MPRRPGMRLSRASILTLVNRGLLVLCVLLVAGLVWRGMQPVHLPPSTVAATVDLPPPPAAPPALETQLFQQRQLFQSSMSSPSAATTSSNAQQEIQTATASLTLMGIVDGAPPQAIIADSKTQRSFFVKEGETFGDGMLVEKIKDGRVTLTYHGAHMDLQL